MMRLIILAVCILHLAPCAAFSADRTVDVPWIVSPAIPADATAGDARLDELIKAHNARQDALGQVTLAGDCVWFLDMEGDPRPMTLTFNREKNHADIACGKEKCTVHEGKVTLGPKSALNIDALYLLAFRKFNPADFKPAVAPPKVKKELIWAGSEKELLGFDPASGLLERLHIQTDKGPLVVSLTDHRPLPGSLSPVPHTIRIIVPPDMYPFERNIDGRATLTVDSARSSVKEKGD